MRGFITSTSAPARGNAIRERLLHGLPVTERRLSLNGVTTAVLEGGTGAPVVLLHGPGAYGAQWLRIIPNLATTHRVIAPDLPGHGESGTFAGPADRDVLAGWLDDLIECTCATAPVLVGSTLGGAIALRFAADHGGRLAALVLVDTLGLTEFRPTPEFGGAANDYLSDPGVLTHDRLWKHCVFDLGALRTRLGAMGTHQSVQPGAHSAKRAPERFAKSDGPVRNAGDSAPHSCQRRSPDDAHLGPAGSSHGRCRWRKKPASGLAGISASLTTPQTNRHSISLRRSLGRFARCSKH